ncbi:zonadhesin [Elysia marginata]|uniref:Zonadhesin n=1 Tax=Elysia marginata TaxID=1093978 RepID=A0AAV4IYF7_9GAST|nr:zonadhesin [Elysia marginata]
MYNKDGQSPTRLLQPYDVVLAILESINSKSGKEMKRPDLPSSAIRCLVVSVIAWTLVAPAFSQAPQNVDGQCTRNRKGLNACNFNRRNCYTEDEKAWKHVKDGENGPVRPYEKGYVYLDANVSNGKPKMMSAQIGAGKKAICVQFFYVTTGSSKVPINFYIQDGPVYVPVYKTEAQTGGTWENDTFSCCLPNIESTKKIAIAASTTDGIAAIDWVDMRQSNMPCENGELVCYPRLPSSIPSEPVNAPTCPSDGDKIDPLLSCEFNAKIKSSPEYCGWNATSGWDVRQKWDGTGVYDIIYATNQDNAILLNSIPDHVDSLCMEVQFSLQDRDEDLENVFSVHLLAQDNTSLPWAAAYSYSGQEGSIWKRNVFSGVLPRGQNRQVQIRSNRKGLKIDYIHIRVTDKASATEPAEHAATAWKTLLSCPAQSKLVSCGMNMDSRWSDSSSSRAKTVAASAQSKDYYLYKGTAEDTGKSASLVTGYIPSNNQKQITFRYTLNGGADVIAYAEDENNRRHVIWATSQGTGEGWKDVTIPISITGKYRVKFTVIQKEETAQVQIKDIAVQELTIAPTATTPVVTTSDMIKEQTSTTVQDVVSTDMKTEAPTTIPDFTTTEMTTKPPTTTPDIVTEEMTTEPPTLTTEVATEEMTTEPTTTPDVATEELTTEPPTTTPDVATEEMTTEPTTTLDVATKEMTTEPPPTKPDVATEELRTEQTTTLDVATEEMTTKPPTATPDVDTEEITTEQSTTTPDVATEEMTTEQSTTTPDVATEEMTTEPPTATPDVDTTEVTTEPSTTKPDVATEEMTTEQSTTLDVATEEMTTERPSTTPDVATEEMTTEPPPTKPDVATEELTTEPPPTKPDVATEELTTEPSTTPDVVTEELTTEPSTTPDVATEEMTTELTTPDVATEEMTTEPKTTTPDIATEELTTETATTTPDVATEELTTETLTTTPDVATEELTTEPPKTTPDAATEELTTEPPPTKPDVVTEELTTEPSTTPDVATEEMTTESTTTRKLHVGTTEQTRFLKQTSPQNAPRETPSQPEQESTPVVFTYRTSETNQPSELLSTAQPDGVKTTSTLITSVESARSDIEAKLDPEIKPTNVSKEKETTTPSNKRKNEKSNASKQAGLSGNKIGLIIGSIVGALILVVLLCILVRWYYLRRRSSADLISDDLETNEKNMNLSQPHVFENAIYSE